MGRMRKNLKEALEMFIESGMVSMRDYPFEEGSFTLEDVEEAYEWLIKKVGL